LHHARTCTNVIYMLRLVGISYKIEESATLAISVVIITLHNNGDAMCSHGNLATTARPPLGAPPSLQRTIEQIAREHTSPILYLYYVVGPYTRLNCSIT